MPIANPATENRDYEARHLLVLEGLEAVRKRPAMYIGSTDTRGLMHCLWEIIDNAVDEALGGFGTEIYVTLRADGGISVHDQGRGIPVDIEPRTGLSGVEVVFTKLHAGGKFGAGSYNATGGLHGVGASVVNALSSRLDVEVDRNGATYAMSFRRGVPGHLRRSRADGEVHRRAGRWPRPAARPKGVTGTRITYWPDRQIFLRDAELSLKDLQDRARQTSFLVPGLALTVVDARTAEVTEETFRHDGGISEFCEFLAPDPAITRGGPAAWAETGSPRPCRCWTTPVTWSRPTSSGISTSTSPCAGGTATTPRSSPTSTSSPPRRAAPTSPGFERALTRAFGSALQNTRLLKAGEEIVKDDVLEGMTAVVTVRLAEPQFEGQTKEVLGTPAVARLVTKTIERELTAFLASTKAATRTQARAVLEKVVGASRARVAARQHREAQRRKNALESSTLPAKLADCRSADVDRSELFIVEGNSALGTAKDARDSEFQALLPIRGKILNVQKASVGDMLKNAECASIIQVVGAGSGRSFDLEAARYGKIIFMADADSDGAHIRCLLATLFFRYMRPLVDAGRVFTAVPPLHRFELTNARKGQEQATSTPTPTRSTSGRLRS